MPEALLLIDQSDLPAERIGRTKSVVYRLESERQDVIGRGFRSRDAAALDHDSEKPTRDKRED